MLSKPAALRSRLLPSLSLCSYVSPVATAPREASPSCEGWQLRLSFVHAHGFDRLTVGDVQCVIQMDGFA